jgi:drug/metabolite transporter (DMT)-like permease
MNNKGKTSISPNLIALLAPISWSFIPISMHFLDDVANILIFTIALAGFVILMSGYFLISKYRLKKLFQQPKQYYLLGIFGILGFHIFYFMALKAAPKIPVLLILNTASILNLIYGAILLKNKITKSHIIAITLNFLAVIIIIYEPGAFTNFNINYYWGFALAFLAANIWAIYSVLSRKYQAAPAPAISIIAAYCIIINLIIMASISDFSYDISISQIFLCLLLGCGPIGLSFIAWNYGMKYGDINKISILAYINPLLAICWLILASVAIFQWKIIASLLLILAGCYIVNRAKS